MFHKKSFICNIFSLIHKRVIFQVIFISIKYLDKRKIDHKTKEGNLINIKYQIRTISISFKIIGLKNTFDPITNLLILEKHDARCLRYRTVKFLSF